MNPQKIAATPFARTLAMTKIRLASLPMSVAIILVAGIITLHFRSYVKGSLYALYDLSLYRQDSSLSTSPVEAKLVAHAGGAVRGLTYTNSRDALDENYAKGYRVFELDFEWTTDDRLVLVHDWRHTSSQFGVPPHVFSYKEFVGRTRRDKLHQLTFEDLHEWLRDHRDAFVVTDTKSSNELLLEYLRKNGGDILPQLIIQIYRLSELHTARQLNPRAVWLTVYKNSYPAWALSMISGVDAFIVPVTSYDQYSRPELMKRVHFYVHSVAADLVGATSQRMPLVYGFYVD
jgi:glycerophosphoryl diester phosphodiesterase